MLSVSGCSISFKGKQSADTGGIFVSSNKGDAWQKRNLILTVTGTPKTIEALSVGDIAIDPSDANAIYFGTIDNGLYYSYNNTKEWQKAVSLGDITVARIAVDPENKCIVYVSSKNKIYKSEDCSRTWQQVYYDDDINIRINSISIDHYDSNKVYLGTSRGEVLKSFDKGISWQAIGRFDSSVKEVIVSPIDSRIVFAATQKKGLHRSKDGGESWTDLSEKIVEFNRRHDFQDMELAVEKEGLIYLATDYGLLRSENYGDDWTKIELITPENEAVINSMALNPKNSEEIYYVTNTTFYRSVDGGESWSTKKLPTSRAGWKVIVNPDNPTIVYLGARTIQ